MLSVARRRITEDQLAFFELDYDDVDDGYSHPFGPSRSPGSTYGGYTPRAWEDVKVNERYL